MDNRVKRFSRKQVSLPRSDQCNVTILSFQLLTSKNKWKHPIDIKQIFYINTGLRWWWVVEWTRLFIVRIGHLDISCWVGLTMSIQFRPCLCRGLLPPCVECRHHLYLVTTDHQSCQQTFAKFSQYTEKAPTMNLWVASKIFANQTVHRLRSLIIHSA